jgi:hypothetical protein
VNAAIQFFEPYIRFWPYAVAGVAGAALAVVDRRLIGRYVFAAVLTIVTIAGAIGTRASQFTWQGGEASYPFYFSILALLFGLSALAGYAGAAVAMWVKRTGVE